VLVVDDDRSLLRVLRVSLSARDHEVSTATTGQEGLSKAATDAPQVIILDLGLPDVDGLEVCRRIRQWSQVPVLVLSATGSEDRKVATLDAGADDYVTKPFSMAELEARIRAALRHVQPPQPEGTTQVTVGSLELDLIHHQARTSGRSVELTAKEFDLLAFLARHGGKVCTHQMILQEVWGAGYGSEAQYLRVYVHRLRQKLGDEEGRFLRTAPGVGYVLTAD
jgi:two-component system KDP operon response regulator KdpE